jgi:hypothetical protein
MKFLHFKQALSGNELKAKCPSGLFILSEHEFICRVMITIHIYPTDPTFWENKWTKQFLDNFHENITAADVNDKSRRVTTDYDNRFISQSV